LALEKLISILSKKKKLISTKSMMNRGIRQGKPLVVKVEEI
jgi:hypothetical protein